MLLIILPLLTQRAFPLPLWKTSLTSVLPCCSYQMCKRMFFWGWIHVKFSSVVIKAKHAFYITPTVTTHYPYHIAISSPSSFYTHLFFLKKFPLSLVLSAPTPHCQYLHPHPSILGCSSRPPANPLISSHLCLSRTISSTHSPTQYYCACMCSHTQQYTILFLPLVSQFYSPYWKSAFKKAPSHTYTSTRKQEGSDLRI